MGKQRIADLLSQLQDNHTQELENAAAIYTVAQVAVDALESTPAALAAALPGVGALSKTQLLDQYGSFNGCRKAAKSLGIHFHKTPSWAQLEAAFRYRQVCDRILQMYLNVYPNDDLEGISFELKLRPKSR
ncbi:hypothetical protein GS597_05600 [Synechococcales cyanobacterium C]|uniref:Uncharacterized protein n=1 Tax=Petrachloros mirabilis ULC683 TaxID=2781853 RepID=A0A8K2A7A7_9CYAN|nr:hypothetical protein [Petrachloros mirabilis]NCJ05994.1 hypothetical protein [Petrachloros mirabilis ULC683]